MHEAGGMGGGGADGGGVWDNQQLIKLKNTFAECSVGHNSSWSCVEETSD